MQEQRLVMPARFKGLLTVTFWPFMVWLNIVLLVGTFAWFAIPDYVSRRPFEAEVWRAEAPQVRERMVADLLKHQQLIGLTRDEVLTLLGPDSTDTAQADQTILYTLGGSEWLAVHFASDGRVQFAERGGYWDD